jgi:hypothetical protein
MAKTRIPPDMLPEPPPERMAACRALWEGSPSVNIDAAAAECGVPIFWARRWKREQGWAKAGGAEMSDRAHQLADEYTGRAVENAPPDPEAAAEVARQIAAETARELSTDHAVDVRAQLLTRQRQEWQAARRLAYEAIRDGQQGRVTAAFERAKLAKIMAETLTLIQAGECRAYGIAPDQKADGSPIIVVERTGPQAEALPPAQSPYRSPEQAVMAGAGDDADGGEF